MSPLGTRSIATPLRAGPTRDRPGRMAAVTRAGGARHHSPGRSWAVRTLLAVACVGCGGGSEKALDPVSGNRAPTATINTPPNNASFTATQPIEFVGSGSDPEDGAIAEAALSWHSSLSGLLGTGRAFSQMLTVGTHRITLTATDSKGASGTAVRSLTVVTAPNQPPTVAITAPANNASFTATQSIQFLGAALDPEDGLLMDEALTWSSSRSGVIGTGASFSRSLPVGTHVIMLRAVDTRGAAASVTRAITVTP